jgi:hypothetical protein
VGGPQFLWWTEFHPVFPLFFSASIVAAYIFTAPTCKATIISVEHCALNADFQHFIPRFNKISLIYGYPWKKGLGRKEAERQDDFTNNFNIYTYAYMPQNIYIESCKCIWQIFTSALCNSKKIIYTLQQDKCKCKIFGHVNVNDLHLHWIYPPYIRLLTFTHTTLVCTYVFQFLISMRTFSFELLPLFDKTSSVIVKTISIILCKSSYLRIVQRIDPGPWTCQQW